MYVQRVQGGLRTAKAVLAELEAFARATSCAVTVEPGREKPEALELIGTRDYGEKLQHVPYVDDSRGVCFPRNA